MMEHVCFVWFNVLSQFCTHLVGINYTWGFGRISTPMSFAGGRVAKLGPRKSDLPGIITNFAGVDHFGEAIDMVVVEKHLNHFCLLWFSGKSPLNC